MTSSRLRLREFQIELAERLRQAKAAPVGQTSLALSISPYNYLIDLSEAGEIIPVPEITPIPLAKSWYKGLANLRGELIGIIDFAQFSENQPTPIDKESCVLTFAGHLRFNAGLLITHIFGLRHTVQMTEAREQTQQAPWLGAAMADQEGQVWYPLSLNTLIQNEYFWDASIAT